jgi:hypothetical protein
VHTDVAYNNNYYKNEKNNSLILTAFVALPN